MDDKMRARTYYAAAVGLFRNPLVDDCEKAIELLNKAIDLYPDFSEASIFREEIWHCLLKSLDPNNDLGTYEEYKQSPAWHQKRELVRERDKSLCVCGAQATEVHHKTYKNIGKELLSDLVALCKECHEREHDPYVPSDLQPPQQLDPCVPDPPGEAYWDKFKAYVKENGNKLQLFPKPDLPTIYGIQIDKKTLRSEDIRKKGAFWLIAYRDSETLQANLGMQSLTYYDQLKKEKDIVEGQFKGNLGELRWDDGGKRVGFLDDTVGHVDETDTDREFLWLHERLIKLHKVFQPRILKL